MCEGILLVNKSKWKTSFSIVYELRRITKVKKIGHGGILDPFATGIMIMLIGKKYTRKFIQFSSLEKEYIAKIHLGAITKTFDVDSKIEFFSKKIPTKKDIERVLSFFQGEIYQIPPMFSAKKQKGKKLYFLARKGIEVEREPIKIFVKIDFISYRYPYLDLKIRASKGTYIRTIAHDIGQKLQTGAFLEELTRTKIGDFCLENCIDQKDLKEEFLYKFILR
ncbi:MAG: tRNA pseudouridine synthase B [Chlamydiae bacterium SM23_39]|nr:MAG: tRNA pseudouridine synthase B [Chlamydiae bacterium SM23_39]